MALKATRGAHLKIRSSISAFVSAARFVYLVKTKPMRASASYWLWRQYPLVMLAATDTYARNLAVGHDPSKAPAVAVIGDEAVLTGASLGKGGVKTTGVTPRTNWKEKVATFSGWLAVDPKETEADLLLCHPDRSRPDASDAGVSIARVLAACSFRYRYRTTPYRYRSYR